MKTELTAKLLRVSGWQLSRNKTNIFSKETVNSEFEKTSRWGIVANNFDWTTLSLEQAHLRDYVPHQVHNKTIIHSQKWQSIWDRSIHWKICFCFSLLLSYCTFTKSALLYNLSSNLENWPQKIKWPSNGSNVGILLKKVLSCIWKRIKRQRAEKTEGLKIWGPSSMKYRSVNFRMNLWCHRFSRKTNDFF